jgi:hypothetical protein
VAVQEKGVMRIECNIDTLSTHFVPTLIVKRIRQVTKCIIGTIGVKNIDTITFDAELVATPEERMKIFQLLLDEEFFARKIVWMSELPSIEAAEKSHPDTMQLSNAA